MTANALQPTLPGLDIQTNKICVHVSLSVQYEVASNATFSEFGEALLPPVIIC